MKAVAGKGELKELELPVSAGTGLTSMSEGGLEQVEDTQDINLDDIQTTIDSETPKASPKSRRTPSVLSRASDSINEHVGAAAAAAAATMESLNAKVTEIGGHIFAEQGHAGESEEKRKEREENAKNFLW